MLPVEQWTAMAVSEDDASRFRRGLGKLELAFALDGLNYSTALSLMRAGCTGPSALLTDEAIERAWARTRRRQPLLAATMHVDDEMRSAYFEVDARTIANDASLVLYNGTMDDCVRSLLRPGAIDMQSHKYLARLYVARAPRSSSTERLDLAIVINHSINDLSGQMGTLRIFLQELAAPTEALPRLRDVLALVSSLEAKLPHKRLPRAVQRWRRAAVKVLLQLRMIRKQGGKTLPKRANPSSDALPISMRLERRLDENTSARAAAAVKQSGIAFGAHHSAFCHLALLRTLYRLRAAGLWTPGKAEWQKVLLEPFHCIGPLNLRPSIGYDPSAQACCISFGDATFPCIIPTSSSAVPAYDEICSRQRYIGRVRMARDQLRKRLGHPLSSDISEVFSEGFLASRPLYGGSSPTAFPQSASHAGTPMVTCFGGSSLGRLDGALPAHYDKGIEMTDVHLSLRVRPGELYIGSYLWRGRLTFIAYVDEATFDRHVVEIFMDELGEAAKHYLGGGPQSRL